MAISPIGLEVPFGTASGKPGGMTDEMPALASAGLMDQVALRRSCPPSFLHEVSERPGGQPRWLSDLPHFRKSGAALALLRPLDHTVNGVPGPFSQTGWGHNPCQPLLHPPAVNAI
jgi:hypothetical protein